MVFLDVIPYELIGEPGGLPLGKRLVPQRSGMHNGELCSTLVADNAGHDNLARRPVCVLAHSLCGPISAAV